MPKQITDNEFKRKVYSLRNDIEILGTYINSYSKIKTLCKKCGREWNALPATLLRGHGCRCNMSKTKTDPKLYEEMILELYKDKFTIIDAYINSRTDILVRCNRCGNEFKINPNTFKKGKTLCLCDKRKSNSQFIDEAKKVNNKVDILSEYINSSTPIRVKCKFCGEEFYQRPSQILNNSGHSLCFKKNINIERHIEEIIKLYPEWNIITEKKNLINQNSIIELRCKKCGYTVSNTINSIKQYIRNCNNCYPNNSNEENSVYKYISKIYRGKIERNKMFYLGDYKKELDIYLPDYNLGIEYDGLYWHSYDKVGKNYQLDKLKFFNKIGIRVIFIRSDEWLNKTDIIRDKIRTLLKLDIIKVPARKLIVREVSKKLKNEFLELYHIQGKDNSSVNLGLFTKKGQLASIMTFSKSRYMAECDDERTYELIRYCVKGGYSIQGGFSKLLKHSIPILKSLGCNKIKTYSDRRYSYGNVYEKCGFKLERISSPNYIYFKGKNSYSRIKFQKHKLCDILDYYDSNLSEYNNMKNNGYLKYYDCGNLVYYFNIGADI